MEKSIDYYMNLPYTVELESDGEGYRASTGLLALSGHLRVAWHAFADSNRSAQPSMSRA